MDQENKDATKAEGEDREEGKEGPVEASASDEVASENRMQDSDMDGKDGEPTGEGNNEHELDQVDEEDKDVDADDAARRASLRTEALIQAAARAVVAKIEKRQGVPEGDQEEDESSRRESCASHIHHPHANGSDSGESSSQQDEEDRDEDEEDDDDDDEDDDVFSDGSGRTSFGSMVDGSDRPASPKSTKAAMSPTPTSRSSPRVSCVSSVMSGLSSYGPTTEVGEDEDREEATIHTPRMPFRTPSSVRAMQMSSPTPSFSKHGFPTVSRLGSPASTNYSAKKTTPRFRTPRKDLPLVLLHVTLLPLRWPWAELLNGLGSEVSEPLAGLRDTWRALQDRVGDTVLERGVLLPHPQDDYEVLEERLLETLELPLLRRARLLECGHYLGYSNMMADDDAWSESEDGREEPRSSSAGHRRHWCRTCNQDIKYESLGAGRVIRVKVYASNGLMRAGAWAACWKEMERVDVELEPILEPNVQAELDALATARREETQPLEEDGDAASTVVSPGPDEHMETSFVSQLASPSASMLSEPIDTSEARRRRDAERMREIYGDETDGGSAMPASPSSTELPSRIPPHHVDPFVESSSPASPCEDAHARREKREQPSSQEQQPEEAKEEHYQHPGQPAGATAYQPDASLPELLWEAVKVLVRDPRNVAIVVLAVFLGFLAVAQKTPLAAHHGYGLESVEAEQDVMMGVGENAPVEALVTSMSAETVELVDMSVETIVVHVQETVTHTETQTQTQTWTETLKVAVTATAVEEVAPMATAAEVEVVAMETEAAVLVLVEVDVLDETPTDMIHETGVEANVEADVETDAETNAEADVGTDVETNAETGVETETAASGGTEEIEMERGHLGPLAFLDLQALETPVHDEI